MDAGDQLVLMEGLGHIIVGAEAEAAHLVLDAGQARQDQDRGLHLAHPQGLQHLVAAHIGQVQIEEDYVVIVKLTEVDALFAKVGRVDVEALRLKHQLDALCRRAIVLDQKHPHSYSPVFQAVPSRSPNGTRARTRRKTDG